MEEMDYIYPAQYSRTRSVCPDSHT